MGTGKIIQADKIQGLADVPNFLSNPNGLLNTSGWTEGSYTAGTRPTGSFTASSGAGAFTIGRTTTNPLGVTGTSLVFTKSSGNQQGRAVETIFALPLDYRAKVLKLSASYINTSTNATDFAAGSTTTDSDMIFYTAYSTDGGTTYTVAEPSSFKILSNSKDISDTYSGSYQTPYNATHLKLIAYVATTSTTAWSIKAVLGVSPSQYVYGTPKTNRRTYTPTITTATGTMTNYTATGGWYQDGFEMVLDARIVFTGAPGTWTGPEISLPAGHVIDFDNASTNASGTVVRGGHLSILKTGSAYYPGDALALSAGGGTKYRVSTQATNTFDAGTVDDPTVYIGSTAVSSSYPFTFASGDEIVIRDFRVPILGWSSSVQMSDGYEGRQITAAGYRFSTDQTITAGGDVEVVLNAVRNDDLGDAMSASTGRYTAKSSGKYRIKYGIRYTTGVTPSTLVASYLKINGTGTLYGSYYFSDLVASKTYTSTGDATIELKAGEYVSLFINSTGQNITVVSTAGTSDQTYMYVEKLSGSSTTSATAVNAFLATGTTGSNITSSASDVVFTTVVTNTMGNYNSSTGVFTAGESGIYEFGAIAGALVSLPTTERMLVNIVTSTGLSLSGRVAGTGASAEIFPQATTGPIPLKSGDTVKVQILMTSGSVALSTSIGACRFYGKMVK